MQASKSNEGQTMVNIRMPNDLRDTLKSMADDEGRSAHNLMLYLLRKAADEYKAKQGERD